MAQYTSRAKRWGFLGLALLLAACTPSPATPTSPLVSAPTTVPGAQGPSQPSKRVSFKAAHPTVAPTQGPLWIAADAGFLDKNNLDVEVVYINPSTTLVQSMLAGEVDFGLFAGGGAVGAVLAGGDLVIVATELDKLTFELVTRPEIKTAQDLRGRTLGISRPATNSDTATKVVLKALGLEYGSDVQIQNVGEDVVRFGALDAGQIDGSVLLPPYNYRAGKSGFNRLLDLGKVDHHYSQLVLVTRRSVIDREPEGVGRFVKAFTEAIHLFKTKRDAALDIVSKRIQSDIDEDLINTWEYYAGLMPEVPSPSVPGVQGILDELATARPEARGANPASFIEPRFVKELEDSGFIRRLYGR